MAKGQNSLSIRKKDLPKNQKSTGLGSKELRFLHEATAGDTTINLSALVTPSSASGFLQPSAGDLLEVGMKFFRNNLILTNGAGKVMRDHIDYQVADSGAINLTVAALAGEVFEGKLKKSIEGPAVVDGSPLVVTGELAIGATDFNVGTPFKVGEYLNSQHGSVLVHVDSQLAYRNENNDPSGDGDYYEVAASAGLGTIIRFNTPDLSKARNISVTSIGTLVNRPQGSQDAVIESLAGQLDIVIPDLALTTGNPESKYQGAPNNVDLKVFGDRVFDLEQILDAEVLITTPWVDQGPITINAVTTPPTKGTTQVDRVQWKREGSDMLIRYEYEASTGGSNGSGNYLFQIPSGYSIDLTKIESDTANQAVGSAGRGYYANSAGAGHFAHLHVYDSTHFQVVVLSQSNQQFLSSTFGGIAGDVEFSFTARVPISGWSQKQTIRDQLGL
jgi:hypothetical protein